MDSCPADERARAHALVSYDRFRTGLTYRDVYQMLWSGSDDPSTWRHKSRGVVLGLWHQIKLELYDRYVGELIAQPRRGPRGSSSGGGRGVGGGQKTSVG